MPPFRFAIAVVLLAAAPLLGRPFTIIDTDLAEQSANVERIDAEGVTLADGTVLPLDEVFRLERDHRRGNFGGWLVRGNGGERSLGTLLGIEDDAVIVNVDRVGPIVLPLERVSSIAPLSAGEVTPPADREDDIIALANGDQLRGLLIDLDNDRAIVERNEGGEVELPLNQIAAIYPADLGRPEPQPAWLIEHETSSRIRLTDLIYDGRTFTGQTAGGEVSLDVRGILSAEQIDGPILWLSTLEPASAEHVPYLSAAAPARVAGRDITAQSASRLTFDIPPGYATFRTRVAIAENNPLADVDLQILLDGDPAWQQQGLTAGPASEPITLDLGDAKTVTLVIDYGRNLDVQDRVNWLQPAFVK